MGATVHRNIAILKAIVLLYILRVYSNMALCHSQPDKPLFLYWAVPSNWKTAAVHKVYMLLNGLYACTYWATLIFSIIVLFLLVETLASC